MTDTIHFEFTVSGAFDVSDVPDDEIVDEDETVEVFREELSREWKDEEHGTDIDIEVNYE